MSLERVPGQARAKRYLKRMVSSGCISHAMLFSGARGSGKAAVALELAKLLNCLDARDLDCCDVCASCRKMAGGNHPDLTWITSDGAFIKLDQIRALRQNLRYRPFEGRWRVIVIQDAQNLNEEAGNALLKILEEPPRQNVLLLTVIEPQMLLPTILSRCTLIRFQPLEDSWIEQYLIDEKQLSPSRAREVARLAEGSMDRARWLIEDESISRWKEIFAFMARLGDMSMMDFFSQVAEWTRKGEDLERDLECIKLWIRDLTLSRLVADYKPLFELDSKMECLTNGVPVEHLFRLYERTEQGMRRLRLNANKQLILETVCLAMKDLFYGQSCGNSVPQGR
jgi:DNA polymerase-3 subunit delta'